MASYSRTSINTTSSLAIPNLLLKLPTDNITMKEAVIDRNLAVTVRDMAIPTPQAGQVLIKVVVSGSNPKDWKIPRVFPSDAMNHGDDIAGYVESVGTGVTAFKKGDKVAAFHEMRTANGSYAEYAIAWEHTTFHLPEKTSFEGKPNSSMGDGARWLTLSRSCNAPIGSDDGCVGGVPASRASAAVDSREAEDSTGGIRRRNGRRGVCNQIRQAIQHPPHHHGSREGYSVRGVVD